MQRYKKLFIILLVLLVVAGAFATFQMGLRYRGENDSQAIQDLQDKLTLRASVQKNRSVTLTIDGHKHSYTMAKLNERIYYKCVDGTTFKSGEEKALAKYLLDTGKTISEEQLNQIIQCECDDETITKMMEQLADTYNTSAKNARINTKGKIIAAEPSHHLNTDRIYEKLKGYLNTKTNENYTASYKTKTGSPEWTTKKIKRASHIICSYSTSFSPSSPRGTNIKIATSRLNNRFLLPDETISFLDVLYDDSDGKTYEKSGAYFKGEVVQATGGGICQVSSTAYATFLFAGIIPEKRYPHSIPVSYAPLGLDAALSVGGKDLQIKNTLDAPILIQAKTKNGRLNIYLKSYKNALHGYRYKPKSVELSKRTAKSYLEVYKGKKKVKTIFLSKDKYGKVKS